MTNCVMSAPITEKEGNMTKTMKAKFINGMIKPLEVFEYPENKEFIITITTKEFEPKAEEKATPSVEKKGKWAKVAEEMAEENFLGGIGDDVLKWSKEFRESFAFREYPFDRKHE